MRLWIVCVLCAAVLGGCERKTSTPTPRRNAPQKRPATLVEVRQNFRTTLLPSQDERVPVPTPPSNLFKVVKYSSPVGELPAYLSIAPNDGKQRPAILWITGGDCNTIGESAWEDADASNDQSARQFREAGIVMMFPALRGGNDAPGKRETFLGEVDDIIAAAEFLAQQPGVNPQRIYLGGHSTGGTLALLTAECTSRFRAVFAFGPVSNVAGYGQEMLAFNGESEKELIVRAPILWLKDIESPTFVIEGTSRGNIDDLREMARKGGSDTVQFLEVRGGTHFSILAPVNKLLAKKILADTGDATPIALTVQELTSAMRAK